MEVGPNQSFSFSVRAMERDGSDAKMPKEWRKEMEDYFEEEGGRLGAEAGAVICAELGPAAILCAYAGEKLGEYIGKLVGEKVAEYADKLFQELAKVFDPDDKIGSKFTFSCDYQTLMTRFDSGEQKWESTREFGGSGAKYRLYYHIEKTSGQFENKFHKMAFQRTGANEGTLYVEYTLTDSVKYVVAKLLKESQGGTGVGGAPSDGFEVGLGVAQYGDGIVEIPVKYIGEQPDRDPTRFLKTLAFHVSFHDLQDYVRKKSQPENPKLLVQTELWGNQANSIVDLRTGRNRIYVNDLPVEVDYQYIGNRGDAAFIIAQAYSTRTGFQSPQTQWVMPNPIAQQIGVKSGTVACKLVYDATKNGEQNWTTDRIRVRMYDNNYQTIVQRDFEVAVTWGPRPDDWDSMRPNPNRPWDNPTPGIPNPPIRWEPTPRVPTPDPAPHPNQFGMVPPGFSGHGAPGQSGSTFRVTPGMLNRPMFNGQGAPGQSGPTFRVTPGMLNRLENPNQQPPANQAAVPGQGTRIVIPNTQKLHFTPRIK